MGLAIGRASDVGNVPDLPGGRRGAVGGGGRRDGGREPAARHPRLLPARDPLPHTGYPGKSQDQHAKLLSTLQIPVLEERSAQVNQKPFDSLLHCVFILLSFLL